MFSNNLSRLIATLAIISWAIYSLLPISDIPFPKFLEQQRTSNPQEFHQLLSDANTLVHSHQSPSLYSALLSSSNEHNTDLSNFFPHINLSDINSLHKRNETLLQYLLQQSQGKLKLGLDLKGGIAFTLKIDDSALAGKSSFEKDLQINKAIDIIAKRVNGLGLAEPTIRAHNNSSIEVQLPSISSQENPDVLNNLKKPAKLSFHLVHRSLSPASTPKGKEPVGYIPMSISASDPKSGKSYETQFFVKRIPEMGGNMIKRAYASQTQFGGYEIHFTLTSDGSTKFAHITENIAKDNQKYGSLGQLAIVLDNQLYSAPSVKQAIHGGNALIDGNFSQRQAIELANVLNNPLEFELQLQEMYEVGPTLADEAQSASINAALLGAGLVIIFMALYYLSSGLVAIFATIANIIITLGVLASLNFTLTLPGVAALVLTVGMAVDSNILIFERIREELHHGKSLYNALLAGYDKAFATIVDANITTFLTAAILIALGTGPIKGFGVTLAIGIASTLFATLVISRFLLDILIKSNIIKSFPSFSFFKDSSFDFLSVRKPAFITSWLILIAGLIALFINKDHIYSIDFTGGDEVSLSFSQKIPLNDIYSIANSINLHDISPSYQSLIGSSSNNEILKIQTPHGHAQQLFNTLSNAFPQADLQIIGESSIGASVSSSIKSNALIALAVALLGILLYVALRFEWGYGFGAVVSTIHDVLLSVGIYVILGGQFSAPMVAAVLMIVGYSINDTIVVFDRIREELSLNPTLSLKNTINLAINKTLSRTLLTSLTTFFAALALFIFGSGIVKDFSLVFILGIITGTFSSIFIASPIFFWWHKGDRKHVEAHELKPKYDWE